jgi:hypothetical protein
MLPHWLILFIRKLILESLMSVNYSLQGNFIEINLNLACVILFNNTLRSSPRFASLLKQRVLNHLFHF